MARPEVVASARNTRSPVWLILASLTPRGARVDLVDRSRGAGAA